jgi:hypothetical protein
MHEKQNMSDPLQQFLDGCRNHKKDERKHIALILQILCDDTGPRDGVRPQFDDEGESTHKK